MDDLFKQFRLEGAGRAYTWKDFRRDYARENIQGLTPEEILQGLRPEERLEGLSQEEIEAYLRKIKRNSER